VNNDEMCRRLESFLVAVGLAPTVDVDELTVLTGGYSLYTARFRATTATGSATYVVRADPPGDAALTHTDRVHEWRVLEALTANGTVPMPNARWADTTGEHLGSPAIILDLVDGPQLLGHLQTVGAAEHRAVALQLADTIGAVHRLGAAAVPDTVERPATWDAYVDTYINGWRELEASHPERLPFIRWVAAWLDGHRPPPAPLTLVHGEFQAGNLMLDSHGQMQVIDWEYAHIGDPRVDLGWFQICAAFSPPDLIGLDPVGFCRRYCDVTGLSEEIVNPLTVGWFAILGGYKSFGGLLQGMAAMAAGQNHLLTSAYLVSAMPFTHRLWRESVRGMEMALAAQMEAVS